MVYSRQKKKISDSFDSDMPSGVKGGRGAEARYLQIVSFSRWCAVRPRVERRYLSKYLSSLVIIVLLTHESDGILGKDEFNDPMASAFRVKECDAGVVKGLDAGVVKGLDAGVVKGLDAGVVERRWEGGKEEGGGGGRVGRV